MGAFDDWWNTWKFREFGARDQSFAAALAESFRPCMAQAFEAGAGAANDAITELASYERSLRVAMDVLLEIGEAYRVGESNDDIAERVRQIVSGEVWKRYVKQTEAAPAK
jgi:hypothetical protein